MIELDPKIRAETYRLNAREENRNKKDSVKLSVASVLPLIPAMIGLTERANSKLWATIGLLAVSTITFGANAIRAKIKEKYYSGQAGAISNPATI